MKQSVVMFKLKSTKGKTDTFHKTLIAWKEDKKSKANSLA